MKKAYEKPSIEVIKFRFAEHIAASGVDPHIGGPGGDPIEET